MQRIVFLSLDDPGRFVIDDDLAVPPLEARGLSVETIPWREAGASLEGPALALVRSTWDYHRHPEDFLAALEAMRRRGVEVENATPLLRWNLDKRYLRWLEEQGVPIVPTLWLDGGLEPGTLLELARRVGGEEVVLKPVVGAGSDDTLRIPLAEAAAREEAALALFRGRPLQLQPFLPAVVEEGEFSLIYLGGEFSHAILKTPAPGDFRVQEEHGSDIVRVEPDAGLRTAADAALAAAGPVGHPLYARVDLVRMPDRWALMELELIEPSLYLRMDPEAPERFARAVEDRLARPAGEGSGG